MTDQPLTWISWKHTSDYLAPGSSIEKKIDVFEAQVWGWQLHIADLMLNGGLDHKKGTPLAHIPHAGFAALQVLLVYFESIGKYRSGHTEKDKGFEHFSECVTSAFPEITKMGESSRRRLLGQLFDRGRSGLYHYSMTKPGVVLRGDGPALFVATDPLVLMINPHVLVKDIKKHFETYIAQLRDTAEKTLRANFEKCFDHFRAL